MTAIDPSVLVLCLGNPDRGDDAIGPAVAEALAGRLPENATLRIRSGDMLALIEDWAGYDCMICVDAAAPMGEPGRIHRIHLGQEELPREMTAFSTHAFGLGEAIALGRSLDLAPVSIVVYAVEGENFESGAPMTAEVAASAAIAADCIAAEAVQLLEHAHHA